MRKSANDYLTHTEAKDFLTQASEYGTLTKAAVSPPDCQGKAFAGASAPTAVRRPEFESSLPRCGSSGMEYLEFHEKTEDEKG